MKMKIHLLVLVALVAFLSGSCKKESQRDIDERRIMEYIDSHDLDATPTGSGLYYVIEEPGNDEHPDVSNTISIRYTGWYLNDQEFDSSDGKVVEFPLGQLIDGWQEGIPLFGKGGKGMLLVPSYLGYGSQPYYGIPGNSVLIFDIELVDFN